LENPQECVWSSLNDNDNLLTTQPEYGHIIDMLLLLHAAFLFATLISWSLSLEKHGGLLFHALEARQRNLPVIKLPYGTWQAKKYDASNDVRHQ
jgi:hypothetical protein